MVVTFFDQIAQLKTITEAGFRLPILFLNILSRTFARMIRFLQKALLCLFALILFSNGRIVELAKLPMLAEHYADHQSNQKDLSFIEFLGMHYWGDDADDTDNDIDHQLPFNDSENAIPLTIIVDEMQHTCFTQIKWIFHYSEKQYYPALDDQYTFNYLSKLIHPPDIV